VNGQCDGCQAERGLPVPRARGVETCNACEMIRLQRVVAFCKGSDAPPYPAPSARLAGWDESEQEFYARLRHSGQVLTPREAPGG
jgi:hypothetical protein